VNAELTGTRGTIYTYFTTTFFAKVGFVLNLTKFNFTNTAVFWITGAFTPNFCQI